MVDDAILSRQISNTCFVWLSILYFKTQVMHAFLVFLNGFHGSKPDIVLCVLVCCFFLCLKTLVIKVFQVSCSVCFDFLRYCQIICLLRCFVAFACWSSFFFLCVNMLVIHAFLDFSQQVSCFKAMSAVSCLFSMFVSVLRVVLWVNHVSLRRAWLVVSLVLVVCLDLCC